VTSFPGEHCRLSGVGEETGRPHPELEGFRLLLSSHELGLDGESLRGRRRRKTLLDHVQVEPETIRDPPDVGPQYALGIGLRPGLGFQRHLFFSPNQAVEEVLLVQDTDVPARTDPGRIDSKEPNRHRSSVALDDEFHSALDVQHVVARIVGFVAARLAGTGNGRGLSPRQQQARHRRHEEHRLLLKAGGYSGKSIQSWRGARRRSDRTNVRIYLALL
jgi:hypothetical protein